MIPSILVSAFNSVVKPTINEKRVGIKLKLQDSDGRINLRRKGQHCANYNEEDQLGCGCNYTS